MKKRLWRCLVVAALAVAPRCHAGWETREGPRVTEGGDGYAVISCLSASDRGVATLELALNKLGKNGIPKKLAHIYAPGLVTDPVFQGEVFAELERIAPKELAAAKRSSGNVHNPKMIALHKTLPEAIAATPTVKALEKTLASRGWRISQASHEKLFFFKEEDGALRFSCILWLTVGPISE